MTNIIDLVKGHVTDELLAKAAGVLGEDTTTTQSGINHMIPALLSTFISKSSNKSGATELFNLVTRPEFRGGLLNNLDGLFAQNKTAETTTQMGGNLLASLMGGQQSVVNNLISSSTGMKSESVSKLMNMITPVLLSVIGKKVNTDGLGLDAFTSMLQGQQANVEALLPDSFSDQLFGALGLSKMSHTASDAVTNMQEAVTDTANTAKETTQDIKEDIKEKFQPTEEKQNKSLVGRILPILLVLAAIALALWLWQKNRGGESTITDEDKQEQKQDDTANNENLLTIDNLYLNGENLIGKTVKGFEYLGTFMKKQLVDGTQLILPSKGGASQLIDFIEDDNVDVSKDKWFELRRLLFETNSATLKPESQTQVENIVAILNAYPDVHLKIGGYTDNTGSAETNKQVSTERANAVMNELIEKGIEASRLEAEGYGQEHPVASNDTEEGRMRNRRVAVRVTKK